MTRSESQIQNIGQMEAVAKDFCLKASFPALELLFPCVSQENFQKQAK